MLRETDDGGLEALDPGIYADRGAAPHLRLVPADSEPPDSEPPDTYEAEAETEAPALRFEDLYQRYFDDVYRSLALLGVPVATREDAAQDVFVVVHRRLGDFEGRSTPRTWILGIARRVASHHRRSGYREWRRRDAWSREVRCGHSSLEGVIENQEAAEILEAFLDTLPEEQREAFVLGAVQGLGRVEIGEALGINPNTAYSRLRLARGRFKERVLDPEAQAELLTSWRRRKRDDGLRARVWSLLPVALTGGAQGGVAFGKLQVTLKSVALGFALALPLAVGALEMSGVEELDAPREAVAVVPAAVVQAEEEPVRPSRGRAAPTPIEWHPHVDAQAFVAEESSPRPGPRRTPRAAVATGPSAELGQLDAELTLLQRAQDAEKRGDVAAARAALQAHARAFPRGRLTIDRDFMLAAASCEHEDEAAAALALQRFSAAHPNTPQVHALQARCSSRD